MNIEIYTDADAVALDAAKLIAKEARDMIAARHKFVMAVRCGNLRHEERGPAVSEKSKRARTARMIRTLQMLGYRVELSGTPA